MFESMGIIVFVLSYLSLPRVYRSETGEEVETVLRRTE